MRIVKCKLSEDMKNQLGISIYVEFFLTTVIFMPKFRQAMEMSHSDSLPLLPASTIKASRPLKQNQLIKKIEKKETKFFPYYLITCSQQLCIVKKVYVTVSSRNFVQILIKVRLMQQNALLAVDTFFLCIIGHDTRLLKDCLGDCREMF